MASIITLLVAVTLSLLVTHVATVALTHTGLSQDAARFQARSAFTGVGFTTSEAESIVGHPVRRRIVMMLMLLGNAGLIAVVSSLTISFVQPSTAADWPRRLALLFGGLAALWVLTRSRWVERLVSKAIEVALERFTDLEITDYVGLLHLARDYSVATYEVDPEDWVTGRSLEELRLADEGVLVLGIERARGRYVGAPTGATRVRPDDRLLLYGPSERLTELSVRPAGASGQSKHDQAVAEQESRERQEAAL